MKKYIRIATILAICITIIGNIVLAADNGQQEQTYDITLTPSYNYGDQKITLEWTGVADEKPLVDYAKVGDYVDYPISTTKIKNNYNLLSSKIRNSTDLNNNQTKWQVIYNDGETIKLISTDTLVSTTFPATRSFWDDGEDYGYKNANPYSYGDSNGDGGGYGVYYQLDQIVKCFADYTYASNVRALDIADLPRSNALVNLKNYLGQIETDNISIELREEGFEEITDTSLHGGFMGIGGSRNYSAKVATITDASGLYTGGKFFLPNYYNGDNSLNAVYYVEGNSVKLHRVYKKGKSITAGVKAVVTLKAGLFKISGDGSQENPWTMSTTPGQGKYTIYQKSEHDKEYSQIGPIENPYITLTTTEGVRDLAKPDKPNAELGLIKGDGWNLKLVVNSGDNGTEYYHKVVGKAGGKEYTSNETTTIIATGVSGFAYCIDNKENTDPGTEIKFKAGEEIKIDRTIVNQGNYIHLKAIDYAGNGSEILHMPLTFVFRDLNLFKTYQEAGDFDDTGIAKTPGWNYVNIDWNPIELQEDRTELPDVVLVLDVSGSMMWNNRIGAMKSGAKGLVDNLLNMYPDMNIGVVHYNDCFGSWWDFSARVLVNLTNDRKLLKSKIDTLYASGENNAETGINLARQLLSQSTKKNRIMIIMTDGGRTASGEASYEASRQALRAARKAGINIKSLLINEDSFASVIYRADNNTICDDVISVRDNATEIYEKIAYDMYQKIQDSMISKYTPYRMSEGQLDFSVVKENIIEVDYNDNGATDKAAPTRPLVTLSETADRDGNIKMDIWAEDRGTSYEFYVKFVHPRTGAEILSNPVVQEIKTGIKGYAWTVSDSATTDPGKTIKPLQFTFGKEYYNKWLHIRAIDYAGNLGEVCHIKIETDRFISWEELNETKELFCVEYGRTIPAREEDKHLNAVVVAGSGKYAIREVVANPKTGDRIGTKFVEGVTENIYGTQPIYSYSLGKYVISPDTPKTRPGKQGNATEQEAYILNYYAQNGSLESAVQKAMYSTQISKGNINWNWEETVESATLLAEANAYASYQRKGYEFSNIKLNTAVYMDTEYKDVIIGPFILKYEPQGMKYEEKETYFSGIVGMKVYNQNNEVISELDGNANNIGNIDVEFIYSGNAIPSKRYETLFTRENYKFPVGYEEFYVKIKYEKALEDVSNINKIEFIHQQYGMDAQYNVLEGTYNRVKWTPNRSGNANTLWCRETEQGATECKHGKTYKHLVGCYFWLQATVQTSYRNMPSQKLIDVLWVKSGYQTLIQTLEPGTGEIDPEYPASNEYTNAQWRLVMDVSGNIWNDGMEDKNNGIKENSEIGIEKVQVNIYQLNNAGKRTETKYSVYSDNVGNYLFKDIKKGIYELEFIYNGQTYKSTKLLVNGNAVDYKNDLTHTKYKNNSVLEETIEARKDFNKAFEEIAGNSTAIGGKAPITLTYSKEGNKSYIQTTTDGYTNENFQIKAITSSNNIYFPISKRIEVNGEKYIKIVDSKDVNMGLAQRYTTDTSLKTDLYEVTFSIKGDKQSYIFSEKNIRDINSNIEKEEYVQEVNRADYNWKLNDLLNQATDDEARKRILESLMQKEYTNISQEIKTEAKENTELETYLDYIIVIRNNGEKDEVQISELANYFTTDLVYLTEKYRDFDMNSWVQLKYDDVKEGENRNKTDKIEITWTTSSKYGTTSNKVPDGYSKIYTTGLDRQDLRVRKSEFLEVHIVFKVDKDTAEKIKLDEDNVNKVSMTEINGYKTYYTQDGSIAGLIDIDSQPGNANPTKETIYNEDDENKAPSLKLKLAETVNAGDTITDEAGTDSINRDNNGNIIGYGNVIEGNVWEDSKIGENTEKLNNNQVIGDGIRQDEETTIQNVTVELLEYFKHPTDSAKDVYLVVRKQTTRTVLSLSNAERIGGGYSFINLPTGNYYTRFIYGDKDQLLAETQEGYTGKIYTGIDYQGVATEDINANEELNKTYEHVELMLVTDISGSMNGESNTQIKEKATTIVNGISSRLPGVKIGLVSFNNIVEVISKPQQNTNNILKAIENLGSNNETAIGYGIEAATNSYSTSAEQKIMIVLTDSEETVQNVEQVIKTLEIATDEENIELISILTKNNYDIFGKPETVDGKAEPRRGEVYSVYNFSEEALNSVYEKVADLSQIEHRRSSAKDSEAERAALIEKYKEMGLAEVIASDVSRIKNLDGEAKIQAATEYAAANKMTAQSKIITFRANNVKNNQVHEINLALMERPLTKLEIESEIVSIKVILPDNTVLIDTAKGISKNVNGLDAVLNSENKELPPITIYMDEEIMHGSTLIVEYKVKLTNKGQIDRLSNYLSNGSTGTVTTSASLVLNYTSKNMLYRDENTENTVTWDNVEINDVDDMIVDDAKDAIENNNLNIYQTKGFAVELYPEGSVEVLNGTGKSSAEFRITLSKLITSQNEDTDLTFDSSLEIVRRANTAGRPSYTERPGNFVPNTSLEVDENIELDSIKERKIIITKPWGGNRSTQYIIIALAALTATAGGILLLKQKQKKKEE